MTGKILLLGVAAVALALPAAALADAQPSAAELARQACKTQQAQMGSSFNLTYGTNATHSNAFGKCIAKASVSAQQALANAAHSCKAEQADAGFAAAHEGKTFDTFYLGANAQAKGKGAGANAYGKCVSTKAKAAVQTQSTKTVAAAKSCRAELAAGRSAFTTKYGKSGTARAAFGRCVVQTLRSTK